MRKTSNIMICVTRQKSCERLIKAGHNISLKTNSNIFVVHIAKTGENYLGNPDEGAALDYLFHISKQVGAQMTVMRSNRIIETLIELVKKEKIDIIVLGESPNYSNDHSIIRELEQQLPDIQLLVVPA